MSSNFREFYNNYLKAHKNPANRLLHYIGTMLSLLFLLIAIATRIYHFFILGLVIGYGLAWIGHFYVEKNKPTTLNSPFRSLICDFVMLYDFLTFNLENKIKNLE